MIPHSHPRWLVATMLAAMVVIVSNGFGLATPRQDSGMSLPGRDAGHDRVLVVDSETDRLTVYDAVDGRPLQQLDTDTAAAAAMLDRHDGRVLVIPADSTRSEPALPQPRQVAASGR